MPDDGEEKVSVKMSYEEVVDTAKNLWTNYLTLTRELLRFINQQDIETFTLIVSNRDQLIKKIDELPSQDYCKLEEFKAIAEQIKPLDREIMYKARSWLNKSRRQNSVVRSYDLGVALAMNQSSGFNRKY